MTLWSAIWFVIASGFLGALAGLVRRDLEPWFRARAEDRFAKNQIAFGMLDPGSLR